MNLTFEMCFATLNHSCLLCEKRFQSLSATADVSSYVITGGEVKIDRKEVEHIAQLARLQFDEAQLEMFVHQLNTILEYFDKLQEIDTSEIEPTSHAVVMNNVFRGDVVKDFPDKGLLLTNAPSKEKGCFKVPKIIE